MTRLFLAAIVLAACAPAANESPSTSVSRKLLPTGRYLDPTGRTIDIGNMPLSIAVAPDNRHAALLLSGYRQRGLQIVDLTLGKVTQTFPQKGAFLGVGFSPDGKSLYTSGAGLDVVYRYAWDGARASLADSIVIAPLDTLKPRFIGALAFSVDGKQLYVAENMSDSLAVVDLASKRVSQRIPTGHYPYAILVARDGTVYVSSWGDSTVDVIRPDGVRKIAVGRHPSAMAVNASQTTLYVVSSSTDQVSVVDIASGRVTGELSDRIPNGSAEGSTPNALIVSPEESTLFVAEADNNAIAVFDLRANRLVGRVPVLWYPTAMAFAGDSLVVVSGKGRGAGPNPDKTYVLGQLNGTLSVLGNRFSTADLAALSDRVARANAWSETRRRPSFPPFEHAILIIKENRTYDQVFGDVRAGDGDSSLLFFDRRTSPNHRALAERFGLYDRFFTNAEVSSQGHPWSTSAYVTEYTEKIVPMLYDFARPERDEGEVDVPVSGFLWDEATRKGITMRNYGEYAEPVPNTPGKYRGSKPALTAFTSPDYPSFDMSISDQRRADAWLAELAGYVRDGRMPALETMHLPGDHLAGSRPGLCTPRACFADNDLALGRIVEALSKSPFWKNTVVFVVEDDSQAGADHVDSHRSVGFVISAYSKPGLVHRFANTTDFLATIEGILHMDALSQFDRFGHPLADVWSNKPDLSPYVAITPAQRIDEVNPQRAVGAKESLTLDLAHADRIDDDKYNRLLWKVIKGANTPYPTPKRASSLDYLRDR